MQGWLAAHPRFSLLFLPRSCPPAKPIERVFGDLHDQLTRNHQHRSLAPLLAEAQQYLKRVAPQGQLPSVYDDAAVRKALHELCPAAA